MLNKVILWLLTVSALILGCTSSEYKVHSSGLKYKFIIENSNNYQAQLNDVIVLKLKTTTPDGELVDETPVFKVQLKKASHPNGCIEDALGIMHTGDSAIFKINTSDYYTYTVKKDIPEDIAKHNELIFQIKIIDIITSKEFEKEQELAKISDKRNEEAQLKTYLQENNIIAEPLMSGLYFIEKKPGTGSYPTPGKKVSVHYIGKFLNNQVFDSSLERNEPFEFYLGIGKVIQGWDEGVARMKIGGEYQLIIPSYLAYGNKQIGPIPPNSTLVFDIELLNAEN